MSKYDRNWLLYCAAVIVLEIAICLYAIYVF